MTDNRYAVMIRNIAGRELAESLAGSLINDLPEGTYAQVVSEEQARAASQA